MKDRKLVFRQIVGFSFAHMRGSVPFVYAQYIAMYGVWPTERIYLIAPMPPSPEVTNAIRSQMSAYANRNLPKALA